MENYFMKSLIPVHVLYHDSCLDGICAAWIVQNCYKNNGITVTCTPVKYGDLLPDIKNSHVVMVDFCGTYDDMMRLSRNNDLVIIDHHKTAKKTLDNMVENGFAPGRIVFDLNHSACMLAADVYDLPEFARDIPRYIEDRDLWQFSMVNTKPVCAELYARIETVQDFAELMDVHNKQFDSNYFIMNLYDKGISILKAREKSIKSYLANSFEMKLGDHEVPACNVQYDYASDVGHQLLEKYPNAPFSVTFFLFEKNRMKFSLRSSNERYDVAAIAEQFGGGGHHNASGFVLDMGEVVFSVKSIRATTRLY